MNTALVLTAAGAAVLAFAFGIPNFGYHPYRVSSPGRSDQIAYNLWYAERLAHQRANHEAQDVSIVSLTDTEGMFGPYLTVATIAPNAAACARAQAWDRRQAEYQAASEANAARQAHADWDLHRYRWGQQDQQSWYRAFNLMEQARQAWAAGQSDQAKVFMVRASQQGPPTINEADLSSRESGDWGSFQEKARSQEEGWVGQALDIARLYLNDDTQRSVDDVTREKAAALRQRAAKAQGARRKHLTSRAHWRRFGMLLRQAQQAWKAGSEARAQALTLRAYNVTDTDPTQADYGDWEQAGLKIIVPSPEGVAVALEIARMHGG